MFLVSIWPWIHSIESDVVEGHFDVLDEDSNGWEFEVGDDVPGVIKGWKGEVVTESNALVLDLLLEVASLDVGNLSGLIPFEIEAPDGWDDGAHIEGSSFNFTDEFGVTIAEDILNHDV